MQKKRGCLFTGVIVGLAMLVMFTVVLFQNEGNAVNRKKALEHIDEAVIISATGDSAGDGQLVILSGDVTASDTLVDETFGVTAPQNTIKLKKGVSNYQWVEFSETDDDDNTTYDYKKMWVNYFEDSSNFEYPSGHQNPEAMIYAEDEYVANDVFLGDYRLESAFTNQLNKYEPYKKMDKKVTDLNMSVNENKIFISENGRTTITSPDIGDYLIEYEIVKAETITVVGQKSTNNIIAYYTKTGNLAEVSYGIKDKAVLKQEKIDENTRRTWAVRIGSIIALMIAVGLLFSPITKLLGRVPILGNIVNGGVALVGGILGGAWGVLVIAVGWLYFKPLLAVALIAGVVAVIVLVGRSKKQKEDEAQA